MELQKPPTEHRIIITSEISSFRNPKKHDTRDLESGTRWTNLTTGERWILMSLIKKDEPGKVKLVWLQTRKGK
ncbi:MAG: hypothetical protein WBF33_10320 [Candidatus Nitrosopolaris sp.]